MAPEKEQNLPDVKLSVQGLTNAVEVPPVVLSVSLQGGLYSFVRQFPSLAVSVFTLFLEGSMVLNPSESDDMVSGFPEHP